MQDRQEMMQELLKKRLDESFWNFYNNAPEKLIKKVDKMVKPHTYHIYDYQESPKYMREECKEAWVVVADEIKEMIYVVTYKYMTEKIVVEKLTRNTFHYLKFMLDDNGFIMF